MYSLCLALTACSEPTELAACLLPGDCRADEQCINGACVPTDADVADDASLPDVETLDAVVADDVAVDSMAPAGEFVDTDGEGGSHMGTLWEEGLEGDGEFVSRVFDAGQTIDWTELQWTPDAPYGKPLPDGGVSERDYRTGSADMSESALLLHFDWSGALDIGAPIADGSGAGHDGRVAGAALDSIDGVFGRAMLSTPVNYASVPIGAGLQFGTDDVSWAFWVRTDESCEPGDRNRVYMGAEGSTLDHAHLWAGCSIRCNDTEPGGLLGGSWYSSRNDDDGIAYCGSTIINDGVWHHVAVTLQRSAADPVTLSAYVDGEVETIENGAFRRPIEFDSGSDFAFSQFSRNTYETAAEMDEAAIFLRALDAEEVRGLYRRGAMRAEFQVRACDAPDCSDGVFAGADGDPAGRMRDSGLMPPSRQALTAVRGRYVQYRVYLSSRITGDSPRIREVRVTGN